MILTIIGTAILFATFGVFALVFRTPTGCHGCSGPEAGDSCAGCALPEAPGQSGSRTKEHGWWPAA